MSPPSPAPPHVSSAVAWTTSSASGTWHRHQLYSIQQVGVGATGPRGVRKGSRPPSLSCPCLQDLGCGASLSVISDNLLVTEAARAVFPLGPELRGPVTDSLPGQERGPAGPPDPGAGQRCPFVCKLWRRLSWCACPLCWRSWTEVGLLPLWLRARWSAHWTWIGGVLSVREAASDCPVLPHDCNIKPVFF